MNSRNIENSRLQREAVFNLGEVVYYATQLNPASWEFKRAIVVSEDDEKCKFLHVYTEGGSSHIGKYCVHRSLRGAAVSASDDIAKERSRELKAIEEAYSVARTKYFAGAFNDKGEQVRESQDHTGAEK